MDLRSPLRLSPLRDLAELPGIARAILDRLRATGEPEVLTLDGAGALVVMDPGTYQALLDECERADAIAAFRRGSAAFEALQVASLAVETVPAAVEARRGA